MPDTARDRVESWENMAAGLGQAKCSGYPAHTHTLSITAESSSATLTPGWSTLKSYLLDATKVYSMPNPLTISMDGRSRRLVIITSVVLILLGVIDIALLQLVSVTLALFVAWLMIIAGGLSLYSTWHGFRERWVVWLKPFVLITFALGSDKS